MRYERKFIIVDKIRISYVDLNPDKKKIIIFFHGNSNSADLWHLQLSSPLFQSYRLIAVDLPCHGQSEEISNISIQILGRLMAQFVINISNNYPFTLVGISLGGNIVAEMLPLIPIPNGIVIISCAIVGDEIKPSDIRSTDLSGIVLFSDQAEKKSVELYFNGVLQSFHQEDVEMLLSDYYATHSSFRGKLLKSVIESHFSNEIVHIRQVNIPCLFMVGVKDDVIEPDLLQSVKLPLWQHKIYQFDKSGHLINLDQPQEFNILLNEYITTIYSHG